MARPARFTQEEDAIIRDNPPAVARGLVKRSPAAVKHRRYILRQAAGERDKEPWSTAEIATMRRHYPTSDTAKMRRLLPGRSDKCIRERARGLKLRKVYLGTSRKVPLDGHMELYDQIAVRAKRDGIPLYKLDKLLDTGTHFRNWSELKKANLFVIAKALDFFGAKLVIDWQDR